MIKFTLKCENDHQFESWFQSAEAFEKLRSAGLASCAICNSTNVSKALMAPSVRPGRTEATPPETKPDLKAQALAEMRRHVEENSDYVGLKFAQEARDMHDGLTPERPIYGEAKPEDAKQLIDDGVPVAPLPFVPGRKTN